VVTSARSDCCRTADHNALTVDRLCAHMHKCGPSFRRHTSFAQLLHGRVQRVRYVVGVYRFRAEQDLVNGTCEFWSFVVSH
jgi:hypothetical protein